MNKLNLNSYNFDLPATSIAQSAVTPRDHSKLLIYNRKTNTIKHEHFYNILNYIPKNAIIVFNNTKVTPARLFGKIDQKEVEILLTNPLGQNKQALVKPGKKFTLETEIKFPADLTAKVTKIHEDGSRELQFTPELTLPYLHQYGELPLPPYIKTNYNQEVANRYQTIYAQTEGSIAAPTAGLHFTPELLDELKKKFTVVNVTLNVGLGTFSPIRVESIDQHEMHFETYSLTEEAAKTLNQAQKNQQPIVTVGTTSTRVLEAQLKDHDQFTAGTFSTNIFIYPGYKFKAITGQITNFHLPKSSLFMLISAFLGTKKAKQIYKEAVDQQYRFYSFGDACLFL